MNAKAKTVQINEKSESAPRAQAVQVRKFESVNEITFESIEQVQKLLGGKIVAGSDGKKKSRPKKDSLHTCKRRDALTLFTLRA
jgi:hypothetical protein